MSILGGALRSLTGAVLKAYIKFEDERFESEEVRVGTVCKRAAGLPPNLPGAEQVLAAAEKAASSSLTNMLGGLMTGIGKELFSSGHIYEVKFNPSEISFQANGGNRVQKMNFAAGQSVKIEFVEMQPRIMMTVPLIFDDYERTDAFMFEKFSDPTALARTAVTGVVNAVTGNTYSVRPQVEGFIAALRNETTRKVTFAWGDMSYKGMLEAVNAEYTMFNMEGNPIRARVNISILLVDESIEDNHMGYWEKSYEKAFDANSSVLGSAVQNVGNLVNIKL